MRAATVLARITRDAKEPNVAASYRVGWTQKALAPIITEVDAKRLEIASRYGTPSEDGRLLKLDDLERLNLSPALSHEEMLLLLDLVAEA